MKSPGSQMYGLWKHYLRNSWKSPDFGAGYQSLSWAVITYQLFIFEKIIEVFSVASFLKSYELCRIAKEINEWINDK